MRSHISCLGPGDYLEAGDYLVSSDSKFFAIVQADGNFCIYAGSGPSQQGQLVWGTGTLSVSPAVLIMQTDGNLCLLGGEQPRDEEPLWESKTAGGGDSFARLQPDSNLCIYSQGAFRWGSLSSAGGS